MGGIGVSLSLVLALVTLSTSQKSKCILTGAWRNELGSNMTIPEVGEDGRFSGLYHTAVSATGKPIRVSPLSGSQQSDSQGQPTLGFTVKWSFTDSTTVFVGQCFVTKDGKEILQTMWLLRKKAESAKDNWESTRVGTNVFTRVKRQNMGEL